MANIRRLRPLFVIGVHRSGTTWVANTLCNHSQIFGLQSDQHYGIKESWFFSHLDGRYGDIGIQSNYDNFINSFQRTYFFKISDVDFDELISIRARNYHEFFEIFMTHAASQRPSIKYWLEKSPVHSLYLNKLISYYPSAKFIAVERTLENVALSAFGLMNEDSSFTTIPLSNLLRTVINWHKYYQYIHHYVGKYPDKFFYLHYEKLLEDPKFFFKACIDFLNLDWEVNILEQRFDRNTSFPGARKNLDDRSKNIINWLNKMLKLLPFGFYHMHERIRKSRIAEPIPSAEKSIGI